MFKEEKGLTLIEVVISLAILGLITTSIFSMLDLSSKVFSRETRDAEVRQEVRTSVNELLKDVQRANNVQILNTGKSMQLEIVEGATLTYKTYSLTPSAEPDVYDLFVDGTRLAVKVLSSSFKEDFAKDANGLVTINLQYVDESTKPNDQRRQMTLNTSVLPRTSQTIPAGNKTLLGIAPNITSASLTVGGAQIFEVTAWYTTGPTENVLASPDLNLTYDSAVISVDRPNNKIIGVAAGSTNIAMAYTYDGVTKTATTSVSVSGGSPGNTLSAFPIWKETGTGNWHTEQNGALLVHGSNNEAYCYDPNLVVGSNFTYQMSVSAPQSEGVGIVVHFAEPSGKKDNETGYRLLLYNVNGKLEARYGVIGQEKTYTATKFTLTGTYTLKIIGAGSSYQFYVVDSTGTSHLVGTLNDASYDKGTLGVWTDSKNATFSNPSYGP